MYFTRTTALKAQFFGVEVNFEKKDGPVIHIIRRYKYPDNAGNETSIPVSMHWQFFWPLRSKTDFEIEERQKPERSVTSVPKSMAVATKYRGLTKASWKTRDLVGITQEGMADLVREFEGAW